MSDVTREQMQEFFSPLIGSTEAMQEFADGLIESVDLRPEPKSDVEYLVAPQYQGLTIGVNNHMREAANQLPVGSNRIRIFDAGKLSAVLLVQALETVADIYAVRATAPQELKVVCENVQSITKHVTSIAYSDQDTALINRAAWEAGKDPNGWLARRRERLYRRADKDGLLRSKTISKKSFTVNTDEDQQLHIGFRFPTRKPEAANHLRCPATMATVERRDGRHSAISIFDRVIGAVAISEIYPSFFTIVDSKS